MTKCSVLLFSIGPVQAFIASGRRCRDLWYGSWLLSALAKSAAEAIEADAGASALVFPAGAVQGMLEHASVANRILAQVPGDRRRAEQVALAAKDAVSKKLGELMTDAFERVGKGDPDRTKHFLRAPAEAQVMDLIEVQWACVEQVDDDGYDKARRQADKLLGCRKNTRVWQQPTWGDGVPKSSLDGALESVLHEDLFGPRGMAEEELYRRYRAHKSERLSGVDLLKRFGRGLEGEQGAWGAGGAWEERFFSTSHVAALPWMTGVGHAAKAGAADAFEAYTEALREHFGRAASKDLKVAPRDTEGFGRVDGGLFFEGRLESLADECDADRAQLEAVRCALRKYLCAAGGAPEPYYAVIAADGDRMGKLIDGVSSVDRHRDLSRALVSFADAADGIVKDYQGATLYTGGDDVMAFVPLHTALQCARELHGAFEAALAPFAQGDVRSSLSVGVAVAHHLTPLDETLELARHAESLAKKERNSLAVAVDKRGGAMLEATGRWDEGEGVSLYDRLDHFVKAHLVDEVSDKTAFDLDALRWVTAGLDDGARDEMSGVLKAEVERVLARKRSKHGSAPLSPEWIQRVRLADDPVRLGRELILARIFAKAQRQAEPKADEAERGTQQEARA